MHREYSVAAKISEYEANQSEYFIIFPSERIFSDKIEHVRSSEMGKRRTVLRSSEITGVELIIQ